MKRLLSPFQAFVREESIGGVILVAVAVVAFAWANSPWNALYETMKSLPFSIGLGDWGLEKALILWVNDGLMAIFFLFVGLEIKRELRTGELKDRRAAALPFCAAVGGMVVPALAYWMINRGGDGIHGWGIPMATDIAFALGIMMLLGDRVPLALKVFLTALAIVDDLGAVLVIAVFYTENLKVPMLVASLVCFLLALGYNKLLAGRNLGIFWLVGVFMWYFMLKSGVHATIAGVLLAYTIPMHRELEPKEIKPRLNDLFRSRDFEGLEVEVEHVEELVEMAHSPLHNLEHALQPWVNYLIMPIFALFNAGFLLSPEASLGAPIALGSLLGLFVGKPVGVFFFSWLAVRAKIASLPEGIGWGAIAGAGLLAGIGFTMSLFIAALAFPDLGQLDLAKLGVLSASVASAAVGTVVLRLALPTPAAGAKDS